MTTEDIKRISIRSYLAQRGRRPTTEKTGYGMYLSPLREETNASFKVDYKRNLWHDFGTGEGGSIIDLVARIENYPQPYQVGLTLQKHRIFGQAGKRPYHYEASPVHGRVILQRALSTV